MTDNSDTTASSRRGFLTGGAVLTGAALAAAVALVAAAAPSSGQHRSQGDQPSGGDPAVHGGHGWPAGPGRRNAAQPADRALREILREIDPDRIRHTIATLVGFGTRHTLSSQTDPHRGIGAARDWIEAQMRSYAAASGGRMTVDVPSYVQPPAGRIPAATRISNVRATLRGSVEPERIYLISGHYDSRVTDVMNFTADAPGADDDASGVAVSMELARVMVRYRPRATLVFLDVAGEEQGLYGSGYTAQQYRAAGADIQGMFTNDIIGSPKADDGTVDPHSVRLFARGVASPETDADNPRVAVGGENDSPARELARFVAEVADRRVTGMDVRVIYRLDRYLRGGDHLSFLRAGYEAACRFIEPNENFAHQHQDVRVENGVQYGDLLRFCDVDYIARVARVNGAALWSLAQAPGTPRGVVIDTSALTNDTTLAWTADPGAAAYEIVWRPTTEPDWTYVIPVGKVSRATVNLAKDNVVFGVRSTDGAGHNSPATFPLPAS